METVKLSTVKLLGDTVERVGKDPVRKLSENDRLIGAARLCVKQGIKPVYVSLGIASGFLFAPQSDEAAKKVQQVLAERGIGEAIEAFCRPAVPDSVSGLMMGFYAMLKNGCSLEEVLERAEKLKRGKK